MPSATTFVAGLHRRWRADYRKDYRSVEVLKITPNFSFARMDKFAGADCQGVSKETQR